MNGAPFGFGNSDIASTKEIGNEELSKEKEGC